METTTTPTPPQERLLVVDEVHGIYCPQRFVEKFRPHIVDAREEDLDVVESGPENEWYWEAWATIETWSTVTLPSYDDKSFRIEQDGDVWLIPEE